MLENTRVEDVDPEDRQILEKLAKLQQMSEQIVGLRTLLPEKLINPTRFALDNPGGYEPERLAAYLHAAAQTGSRDVERFKKEWHSEDIRQLLNIVNTTELPQGTDAWDSDYGGLLHGVNPIGDKSAAVNGIGQHSDTHSRENALESINNFRTKHPGLIVEVLDEAKGLPVNITITANPINLKFRVDESADGTAYKVVARPNTESTAIRENILQNISGKPRSI